ncbi:MAG: di-heme oxidoredictase family protein [Gemmatimonadaceae bacterium]
MFTPEEGLGPFFNENQCSACHTVPASGGTTGFERITKATRFDGPGSCDLLVSDGGENVRKQATPLLRALGVHEQTIPPRATEIGRFTPPALFGLGLIEAIPDEAILAGADPDDADGDGISGRPGRTSEGQLGRFGRKADVATIQDFVESALRLEMGLTTPARPDEVPVAGVSMARAADPARDPEVPQEAVELLTAFIRFLGPPAPIRPRSAAHNDTIAGGRRLFHELRCSTCHTPTMRTGDSGVDALDQKTVTLYSDLLLHDLGPGLANVCAPSASPTELRTEMLMGLRHRNRLMHDGRTSDLREAILAHGGEAQRARDAFARLPWLQQEFVVRFLRSL